MCIRIYPHLHPPHTHRRTSRAAASATVRFSADEGEAWTSGEDRGCTCACTCECASPPACEWEKAAEGGEEGGVVGTAVLLLDVGGCVALVPAVAGAPGATVSMPVGDGGTVGSGDGGMPGSVKRPPPAPTYAAPLPTDAAQAAPTEA